MLGHPGISAFEYGGSIARDEKKYEKKYGGSFFRRQFRDSRPPPDLLATTGHGNEHGILKMETVELEAPTDEWSMSQRRRGTFLNHTPRDFELRSSRRSESADILDSTHFHQCENCGEYNENIVTETSNESFQHTFDFAASSPAQEVHTGLNHAQDLLIDGEHKFERADVRSSFSSANTSGRSYNSNIASRKQAAPLKTHALPLTGTVSNVQSARHSREASKTSAASTSSKPRHNTNSSQSSRKVSGPSLAESSRHAPMEPLVAHHRRKVTGSDVDTLPPTVDVNDVGDVAGFMAFGEYFESQAEAMEYEGQRCSCGQSLSDPARSTRTDEGRPPTPIAETALIFPAFDLEQPEGSPRLPHRNPQRLTGPPNAKPGRSALSTDIDFASAATGNYSPWDPQFDTSTSPQTIRGREPPPTTPKSPKAPFVEETRVASASSGRLAPSIPLHEQLASNSTSLDELSYFLRMTGPPMENAPPPQKKKNEERPSAFRKIKKKKSLATKSGTTEGAKRKSTPPPLPYCAREMTTSGGSRHLQIVIPISSCLPDQEISVPVHDTQGQPKRVSLMWSDEMLNPLASPKVEKVIAKGMEKGESSPASAQTMMRSPKPTPSSPTAVGVDQHPLQSREEQTRVRKLRDREKRKQKIAEACVEDTNAGASSYSINNSEPMSSPTRSTTAVLVGEAFPLRMPQEHLQKRLYRLEKLNDELTQELAIFVGLDLSDRIYTPEDVLAECRALSPRQA